MTEGNHFGDEGMENPVEPLSDSALSLLDDLRDVGAPPEGAKHKVRAQVAALISAGVAGPVGYSTAEAIAEVNETSGVIASSSVTSGAVSTSGAALSTAAATGSSTAGSAATGSGASGAGVVTKTMAGILFAAVGVGTAYWYSAEAPGQQQQSTGVVSVSSQPPTPLPGGAAAAVAGSREATSELPARGGTSVEDSSEAVARHTSEEANGELAAPGMGVPMSAARFLMEGPEGETMVAHPRGRSRARLVARQPLGSAGASTSARVPVGETEVGGSGEAEQQALGEQGSASSLRAEIALLRRAQGALRRDDFAEVREVLSLHRQRFPDGAFRGERRALDALLRCVDGRPGAAEAVREFLEREPGTSLAVQLRERCL